MKTRYCEPRAMVLAEVCLYFTVYLLNSAECSILNGGFCTFGFKMSIFAVLW